MTIKYDKILGKTREADTGGVAWGDITGTLSAQSDLQTVLDSKVNDTGNETIAGVKTFSSFPVTPSAEPSTDYQVANKKYVDDNSGGTTKEYASFYLGTGGQTGMGSTATTLTLNQTQKNSNGSVFSLASSQVTINKTGTFMIVCDAYLNLDGSARTEYSIWLEKDATEVSGTRSGIYLRGYDSGSTGTITTIIDVTSGEVLRIRCQLTDGSASTAYQDNNGTRLTIMEV